MTGGRRGHLLADYILESPITWLITAINIGVFLIAYLHDGGAREGLSWETLVAYGGSSRYRVQGGDYWRLLTAVFLHGGWVHLVVNTVCMVTLNGDVERTVGSIWFSIAYISTGIGASAISVLAHPTLSVGASGAGFGMVAVMLSMLYRRERSWEAFLSSTLVRRVLGITLILLVVGFLLLSHIVDNYAHLGGFLLGIPCGLIVENRRGRNRPRWIAAVVAYMVVVTGLVVVACMPGMGWGRPGE